MKFRTLTLLASCVALCLIFLQSNAAGRASANNRDNTGAPGGQVGGNGSMISCQNCHSNGDFEVGLNLELLDANDAPILQYTPNQVYKAKVTIETLTGSTPDGFGFQMISLFDADDADVSGWRESGSSSNVQINVADRTGRLYAEQDGTSSTNEFTTTWQAPDVNSGDISFYLAGVGVNGNRASSSDHSPDPIKLTFPEEGTSSTSEINQDLKINVYPNPTCDKFTIHGEIKGKTVEIYQSEKLIKSIRSENQDLEISLRNLASGTYLVVVKNNDNQIVASKRVIRS